MPNYSAKDGLFFERNAGVPPSPVNPGTGGEQFYHGRLLGLGIPSEQVNLMPNGEYSVQNGVTPGEAGSISNTAGMSA